MKKILWKDFYGLTVLEMYSKFEAIFLHSQTSATYA